MMRHLIPCVFLYLCVFPTLPSLAQEVREEYFVLHFLSFAQSGTERAVASQSLTLDADTGISPPLDYLEVFDPPVVPYQRNAALSALTLKNGELHLLEHSLQRIPLRITPYPNPDAIQRKAKLHLNMSANTFYPIPSDSPQMQILSVSAKPPATFSFFKDEHDMLYIVADQSAAYDIALRTQSPPQEGQTPGLNEAPSPSWSTDDQNIRAFIEQSVQNTAAHTILAQNNAAEALYTYFRDFDSAPLSTRGPRQALLHQILEEQKGLCRHRGFAYVALAQYLGYRVRLIINDAHAFVEIYQHGRWKRLELGGQAEGLNIRYSDGRASRRLSRAEFSRDEEGEGRARRAINQHDALSGDGAVSSQSPELLAVARVSALGALRGDMERASAQAPLRGETESGAVAPGSGAGGDFPHETVAQRAQIFLDKSTIGDMKRGERLRIAGIILASGLRPVPALSLSLMLLYPDTEPVLLARTRTNPAGAFVFVTALPLDVPLGLAELRIFSDTVQLQEAP